jgi:hypothetical protein
VVSVYDLYLWTGCQSLPPLRDLSEAIPVLADPAFQHRFMTTEGQVPGWLDLDLERSLAQRLLKRLRTRQASGMMALGTYHQPAHITLEQAIHIARPFLVDIAAWHHADLPMTFETADLTSLSPMCWVISAYEWRIGERTPPPKVYVDKLDGHIWSDGEMNLLQGV